MKTAKQYYLDSLPTTSCESVVTDSVASVITNSLTIGTKMEEIDLKQFSMCQHLFKLLLDGEIGSLPEHNLFPPSLTKLTLHS